VEQRSSAHQSRCRRKCRTAPHRVIVESDVPLFWRRACRISFKSHRPLIIR
jgi:hypothetical protein